jgi:hypothetical protein
VHGGQYKGVRAEVNVPLSACGRRPFLARRQHFVQEKLAAPPESRGFCPCGANRCSKKAYIARCRLPRLMADTPAAKSYAGDLTRPGFQVY